MDQMNAATRWIKRILLNAAALLAFPVLLFGAYLIDQSHTVVRDFRVTRQMFVPEGVMLEGTMDKERNCRFVEVVAMLDEVPAKVLFLDTRERSPFTRPIGPQTWGPWLIEAQKGQGVQLHARHRCHFGWDHTEVLTSFVVGVQ